MEISFKSCVPCDPSAQAKLVSDLLLTGVNDHDFLDFLSTRFSEDFDEVGRYGGSAKLVISLDQTDTYLTPVRWKTT
eukprot:scaffold1551_cov164-Ochromonas_danica.AAC.20